MKAKHLFLILFAWYFVVMGGGNSNQFTQVGPFDTKADCINYSTTIYNESLRRILFPCWQYTEQSKHSDLKTDKK